MKLIYYTKQKLIRVGKYPSVYKRWKTTTYFLCIPIWSKLGKPLIIMALLFFTSCTKSEYVGNTYTSYQLVRDWYTMDTTFVNRAVLWKDDKMYRPEDKAKIEAEKDQWKVMCETATYPLHLEHWYYLRNGIKIHQSKYPKS